MKTMNEFKARIKAMCKTKEEVPEEKKYTDYDIRVVEDTVSGDIYICTKEALESDKLYTRTISANNIEDGNQIAEYRVNALPAGRACFGGYTYKKCNEGKRLYSFSDVWYKIYGEQLQSERRFTRSELLEMLQEINEKFKDAKFTRIYSAPYKNPDNRLGTPKYFLKYLEGNGEIARFEMLDDGDKSIEDFDELAPETELIAFMGTSRIYTRAKFTKEACRKIVRDYEKERKDEGR